MESSNDWAGLIASGEVTPAAGKQELRDIEPIEIAYKASEALADLRDLDR